KLVSVEKAFRLKRSGLGTCPLSMRFYAVTHGSYCFLRQSKLFQNIPRFFRSFNLMSESVNPRMRLLVFEYVMQHRRELDNLQFVLHCLENADPATALPCKRFQRPIRQGYGACRFQAHKVPKHAACPLSAGLGEPPTATS